MEETCLSRPSSAIDVGRAQKTTVLNRVVLDAVPASTNIQARAQLVPGMRPSVVEVGAVQSVTETSFSVHGLAAGDNTLKSTGSNSTPSQATEDLSYYNDMMFQEVTYGTSAATAEVSGGGARVSILPRDGGNTFSGTPRFRGADTWQADNLTDRLKELGVRSVNSIDKLYDVAGAQGGPLVRTASGSLPRRSDGRSTRQLSTASTSTPMVRPQLPGIDDQNATSALVRLRGRPRHSTRLPGGSITSGRISNHFFAVGVGS